MDSKHLLPAKSSLVVRPVQFETFRKFEVSALKTHAMLCYKVTKNGSKTAVVTLCSIIMKPFR